MRLQRILIVNPVRTERDILKQHLRSRNAAMEFIELDSGDAAFACYRRKPYDMVLFDVDHLDPAWLDVVRRILTYDAHAFVAVFHGDANRVLLDKALEAGVRRLCEKPISLQVIADLIQAREKVPPRPVRVLAADRSAMILVMLKRGFDFYGIDVAMTGAQTGAEAIGWFEKEAFDLIFLDTKMPKMTGLEVLAKIKKVRPDNYIVMMPSEPHPDTIALCQARQANDILVKPFKPERFKAVWTHFSSARARPVKT